MQNNIYYLHGVIDTLKEIIHNNTSIKVSSILKDKFDDGLVLSDISDDNDECDFISKLDTAKNYIVLLEKLCSSRIKNLQNQEIEHYTNNLKKCIPEIVDKLKTRGLDDKKIFTLIRTKYLKPFECKFLFDFKYEDISLTSEDIQFLLSCNTQRYSYKRYKGYNKTN